jgi:enamine deaminase RidA (YjgF/YER057c/UK114 family)
LPEEARLSASCVGGGLVWLAGQVADDPSLDAEGQTADILAQIDALLAEAGTDKRALLSVTIVLADIGDAPAMNRAWDAWLDASAKPARMTIEAALVDPRWKVEITGVARRPARQPLDRDAAGGHVCGGPCRRRGWPRGRRNHLRE